MENKILSHIYQSTQGKGLVQSYSLSSASYIYPYPETTGYAITTLINYGNYEEAEELGLRLVTLQRKDGGFPPLGLRDISYTFDTCQILDGLYSLYIYNNKEMWLDAIKKAVPFIKSMVHSSGGLYSYPGAIDKTIYGELWADGISYTHVKSARIIYNIGTLLNDKELIDISLKLIDFSEKCLEQSVIYSHPFAYLIQGIIDMFGINNIESRFKFKILDILKNKIFPYIRNGYLPYIINTSNNFVSGYSYVSGVAQFAYIFKKLGFDNTDLLEYVELVSINTEKDTGLSGAIYWYSNEFGKLERYSPAYLTNTWANKFYLDAKKVN